MLKIFLESVANLKQSKINSRKLLITVLTSLLVVLNGKLKIGLDGVTIAALSGLVATYVISQGYVDGKNGVLKVGRPKGRKNNKKSANTELKKESPNV